MSLKNGARVIVMASISTTLIMSFQNCSSGLEAVSNDNIFHGASLTGKGEFSPDSRTFDLPDGFGTAHESPRYNPMGEMSNVLADGALDAYRLGMKTFKVYLGGVAKVIPAFYQLQPGETSSITTLPQMAAMPQFKAVFDLPFKTFFVNNDEMAALNFALATVPLTAKNLEDVYRENYELTKYFLTAYKGSRKTFFLQNHEGDWHAAIWNGTSYSDNTAIGTENYIKYWSQRQKAIDDAKRDTPSDVEVYHMCEVVRVRDGWANNKPTLTRDVLPHVNCDMIGYSAHDSSLYPDDGASVYRSIEYIKQYAPPSKRFGTNHVAVSEIGLPEARGTYDTFSPQIGKLMARLLSDGIPYVLFWTMYDNEVVGDCDAACLSSSITMAQSSGYWVRRPDGTLGNVFTKFLEALGQGQGEAPQLDRLKQVRTLSQKYFSQISEDSGAVNKQLTFLSNGGTLKSLEDYFALVKNTWSSATNGGQVVDYKVVDAGMSLLVEGGTQAALLNLFKSLSEGKPVARLAPVVSVSSSQISTLYQQYLPGCFNGEKQVYWERWAANGGSLADLTTTLQSEAAKKPPCLLVTNSQPASSVSIPKTEIASLFNQYLPGCWTQTKQSIWEEWFGRGGKMADFVITLQNEKTKSPPCMVVNAPVITPPTATPAPVTTAPGAASACPSSASGMTTGSQVQCYCSPSASSSGTLWGSLIYTADSALCRAAVHANVISVNGGNITVQVSSGQSSYSGTTSSGVTSNAYGSYGKSFSLAGGSLSNQTPNSNPDVQAYQESMNRIQLDVMNNYNIYLPGCWTPEKQSYWEAWFTRGGTLTNYIITLQNAAAENPPCLRR